MAKVMTDFNPRKHGFHFSNGFVNNVCDTPFGTITTKGRCGGMAYAALDYYYSRIPVPTHQGSDFPGGSVPPDHSRLADYIYDRLMDSFLQNGSRFISWTVKLDHGTWVYGDGVSKLTKDEEFPKLMKCLETGPVALGLIKAEHIWDIGKNHQVVAYGAEVDDNTGTKTVYIYDNNAPDTEVILTSVPSDPHFQSSRGESWRGWFVEDYSPVYPPYVDLAVIKGLSISPPRPAIGDPLDCTYTVKNFGEFPSHIHSLNVEVALPPGESPGAKFTSDTTAVSIGPQQEHVFAKHCDIFAGTKGKYTLRISCMRLQDVKQELLTSFEFGGATGFIPTSDITVDVEWLSQRILSLPPCVESIEVLYGTPGVNNALKACEQQQVKYRAAWARVDPSTRHLDVFSEPIIPQPNKNLVFNIRFLTDGKMRKETLKLTLTGRASDGSTVNVPISLNGSGQLLTGSWIPQLKGSTGYRLTMAIEGSDDVPRYSGRTPRGDVLDSQPQTLARVDTAAPGYPFRNYEPGTDTNYSIELAPPQSSMTKDILEANDSFATAAVVLLAGATPEIAACKSFNNLNFHSSADKDFFSVKFESLPSDDNCPLLKPDTDVLSEYLGLSVTHYPPSLSMAAHSHESCMDLEVYKNAPGPQLIQSFVKECSYSTYNPAKIFPGKTLFAVLKNSNFTTQGVFSYNVWFSYSTAHDVLSVDINAPAYRARPDISRKFLKRYYDMIDLPRPPDEMLMWATDSSSPYPANSLVINDRKRVLTRMQDFFTSAETLSDLTILVPGKAHEIIAGSCRNLGKMAQAYQLKMEAEGLFHKSADMYAVAKRRSDQIAVLEELAAFHVANGETSKAAGVRRVIAGIPVR